MTLSVMTLSMLALVTKCFFTLSDIFVADEAFMLIVSMLIVVMLNGVASYDELSVMAVAKQHKTG